MRVGYYRELPVMMAVREPRSGEAAVTSSAVDLEPKPLSPWHPRRYLIVSSIFFTSGYCCWCLYACVLSLILFGLLLLVFVWLCPFSVPRNKDFELAGKKKKVEKGRRDWNRLSGGVGRLGILKAGGGRWEVGGHGMTAWGREGRDLVRAFILWWSCNVLWSLGKGLI